MRKRTIVIKTVFTMLIMFCFFFAINVFASETSRESNEITVHLLKSRNSETMPEPQQVRINPQYYMVGTGVKVEDGGSPFKEQEVDYSNSIESVLSGETIDLSSIFS